jgi:hypothetical protein
MKDEKIIELAHRHFDGDLSGREEAEFNRMLAEDSKAREIVEQVGEFFNSMESIDDVEAPSEMQRDVMRRIDFGRYRTPAPSPRPSGWGEWAKRVLSPDFAWPFATGAISTAAVALLVVIGSFGTGAIDRESASGTMGVAVQPVERTISIDEIDISASITYSIAPTGIEITARWTSPEPVDLIIEGSDGAYGVQMNGQNVSAQVSVAFVEENIVLAGGTSGSTSILLVPVPGVHQSPVRVVFETDGRAIPVVTINR